MDMGYVSLLLECKQGAVPFPSVVMVETVEAKTQAWSLCSVLLLKTTFSLLKPLLTRYLIFVWWDSFSGQEAPQALYCLISSLWFNQDKCNHWKYLGQQHVCFGIHSQPVQCVIAAVPWDGRGGWQLVCHKSPCVSLCPIRRGATSDGHLAPSLAPQRGTCCRAACHPITSLLGLCLSCHLLRPFLTF